MVGFALNDGCGVGKDVGGCEGAGAGSRVGTFEKKNKVGCISDVGIMVSRKFKDMLTLKIIMSNEKMEAVMVASALRQHCKLIRR